MRLYEGGTDGNRTSDTRIFSPLLYQLSYGTSVLWLQKYDKIPYRQEKNFKILIFFYFSICLWLIFSKITLCFCNYNNKNLPKELKNRIFARSKVGLPKMI